MTKRKKLQAKVTANCEKIKALKNENYEIGKQLLLLCDDEQWFTEKTEVIAQRENGKKVKVAKLIGRIHWKEDFKDDSSGEVVTIDRSEIVRVDGNWEIGGLLF